MERFVASVQCSGWGFHMGLLYLAVRFDRKMLEVSNEDFALMFHRFDAEGSVLERFALW